MYTNIEIRKSSIHGKGVFAKNFIPVGTLMCCDVLVLRDKPVELRNYSYPWRSVETSLCMGFGSYFNHSQEPNVKIKSIDTENLTKTFITLRDIACGEELTIRYSIPGKEWEELEDAVYEEQQEDVVEILVNGTVYSKKRNNFM
jgi:SET domain-containing protein